MNHGARPIDDFYADDSILEETSAPAVERAVTRNMCETVRTQALTKSGEDETHASQ